jgi:hypothetical protein
LRRCWSWKVQLPWIYAMRKMHEAMK